MRTVTCEIKFNESDLRLVAHASPDGTTTDRDLRNFVRQAVLNRLSDLEEDLEKWTKD